MLLPGLFLACALGSCGGSSAGEEPARLADAWAGEDAVGAATRLEVPGDAPRVAFLGDSMSAGLHLDEDLAFPAVAQRLALEAGTPFHLVNAGVSGDTTAGGLSRVDWLLKQEPAVVVVELGCNDGLRGLALADIEANLRGILQRIRAAGATPLLLGMYIPPSYGEEYSVGFARLYEDLAAELDVALVPGFLLGVGGERELNLADGIHPNARGHELLGRKLVEPLGELLGGG